MTCGDRAHCISVRWRSFIVVILCTALLIVPRRGLADPPESGRSDSTRPQTGERRSPEDERLEEQIAKELQKGQQVPPSTAVPAPPAFAGTGASPYARLLLLPDISAIGDFAGAYDTRDVPLDSPRAERDPRSPPRKLALLFQELELGFQAVVDPYARADIFVSFEEGSVNVEEASAGSPRPSSQAGRTPSGPRDRWSPRP